MAMTFDPVCGMTVDPNAMPHGYEYQSRSYHFCSEACRTKFAADPARYLDGKAAQPASARGYRETLGMLSGAFLAMALATLIKRSSCPRYPPSRTICVASTISLGSS